MKFGLRLPTYILPKNTANFHVLASFARKAEKLGFDSLWVVDHLMDARPSYMCSFMEPLTVISMVAAVTNRVRVGTSILVLPLRNPVLLAKEVATIDWLSGGRFDLGIGIGWNEKEFEACQVPYEKRGRRTDEMLDILIKLWTEDNVNFRGSFYELRNVTIDPKPVQKPHPPIIVGGGSIVSPRFEADPSFIYKDYRDGKTPKLNLVYRRVARYARAWHVSSVSNLELVKKDWEQIAKYAREFGRDPNEIEICQTTYMYVTEDMEEARKVYRMIVGKDFTEFALKGSYFIGRKEDIIQKLEDREKFGIKRMILTPLTLDVNQLDFWYKHILSRFIT